MEGEFNNDGLLRELGGCGLFQVILATLGSLPYLCFSVSAIFMSFGLVNPGWRCQENNTTNANNSYSHYNNHHYGGIDTTIDVNRRGELFNQTNTQMTIYGDVSDNYTESCVDFNTMSCQNIEFSPEASTIVTEWGLVCDKSWIPAMIITIQTVGGLLGGIFGGYFGDKYGRKRTVYISLFVHGILNIVAVLCPSWQTFAVVRFLTGVSYAVISCNVLVYTIEFVSPKWRSVMVGLPLWTCGCLIYSLVTYVFKDWKYVIVFNGVFSFLICFSASVLPESLRWLIAREKSDQSLQVVAKIAKINKVSVPKDACLALLEDQKDKQRSKRSQFSFISLFRKELRLYTFIFGLGYFSAELLYYSTGFGLSSLPGDFYVNNIIVYACDWPSNITSWFAPNIFGRRPTICLGSLGASLALMAVVMIDRFGSATVQEYGILVMVILARNFVSVAWFALVTSSNELLPAVARSKACGWRLIVTNVAAMISPHIIPNDGSNLSVPFIVLALFPLSTSFLALLLPETRGKVMEDDVGGVRV